MDLTTIIGSLITFGIVGYAMATGEGGLGLFFNVPSILIVVGGSVGVTIVNFTMDDLKAIAKIFLKSVLYKSATPSEEIDRIVAYSNLARKEGLLSLESKLQELDDAFFAKGVQLVIDGFSGETVRDIMTLEAEWQRQRHSQGKKILDQMATFAPAFGMIGTLVGLIQMLVSLSDPSKLGAGIRGQSAGTLSLDDLLEPTGRRLEVLGGQLSVVLDPAPRPQLREHRLELVVVDPEDDVSVHLDEAAVGVPGEVGITREARQCVDDCVVDADVEDRVHHAWHRELGARTDGEQQRLVPVTERAAGGRLEPVQRLVHLPPHRLGQAPLPHRFTGDLRGDGEPWRHGQPE